MLSRNTAARLAVLYFFVLEGVYNGVLSSYLPSLQDRLKLSDSTLGAAMLFSYVGQVAATPWAGMFMRRWGSRKATVSGAVFYCIALPLLALTFDTTSLCFVLLFFGLSQGLMDCTMNSCAVVTEAVQGYPILGQFHGSYSVAAAGGAFIGAALHAASTNETVSYAVCAGIALSLCALSYTSLYSHKDEKRILPNSTDDMVDTVIHTGEQEFGVEKEDTRSTSKIIVDRRSTLLTNLRSIFMIPQTKEIAALSLLGFLAAYTESAINTWLFIYYGRYFPNAASTAKSAGFIVFEVAMGSGRFCSDFLRKYFGSRKLAQFGGILAGCGLGLLVWAPSFTSESSTNTTTSPDLLCAGFGMFMCGCGISTLIPVSFAGAGYSEGHSGTAVATVGCWMYAGGIISSPLLGAISNACDSLRYAFILLAICAFTIAPIGCLIPEDRYANQDKQHVSDDQDMASSAKQSDSRTPLLP
jgi:MFS family permease